jgi:hypothetical protein
LLRAYLLGAFSPRSPGQNCTQLKCKVPHCRRLNMPPA